jgi:transcriptional regulator with XRE-family HTH domain
MATTTIRDLREKKQLSQDKVAAAAGLTYSAFVRIEEGSGKTTPAEIKHVLSVLKGMEPGTRKLAGRPFKDPAKQAAVAAARAEGRSVHEVIAGAPSSTVSAPAAAPAQKTSKKAATTKESIAKALAKKAPARSARRS